MSEDTYTLCTEHILDLSTTMNSMGSLVSGGKASSRDQPFAAVHHEESLSMLICSRKDWRKRAVCA